MNNPELALLVCPTCQGEFAREPFVWKCRACGREISLSDGMPMFSPVPATIQPFEKVQRGPDMGTPWRQANWAFLASAMAGVRADALIVDVGAGHGDFAEIFKNRRTLSLDVVPYPEVDLVCDLTQTSPFRPECVDVVVLMNVLEHVSQTGRLLGAITRMLKPGGLLIMAVPFLLKIHQAPFDFVRFTHFQYERLAQEFNWECVRREGYYHPVFLFGEASRNVQFWELPRVSRSKRLLARLLLSGINLLSNGLTPLVGGGKVQDPLTANSPAPVGYQLIYQKRRMENKS